jgi:predicted RNA-binding Zn-ribbon protein involved in translation (DUF1610 family)
MWDQVRKDKFKCSQCGNEEILSRMDGNDDEGYRCPDCGSFKIHNITPCDLELSEEDSKELQRRMADLDCKKRYVIKSTLTENWVTYFNVESAMFCDDIKYGTAFKRKLYANAVIIAMCDDEDDWARYSIEEIEID